MDWGNLSTVALGNQLHDGLGRARASPYPFKAKIDPVGFSVPIMGTPEYRKSYFNQDRFHLPVIDVYILGLLFSRHHLITLYVERLNDPKFGLLRFRPDEIGEGDFERLIPRQGVNLKFLGELFTLKPSLDGQQITFPLPY